MADDHLHGQVLDPAALRRPTTRWGRLKDQERLELAELLEAHRALLGVLTDMATASQAQRIGESRATVLWSGTANFAGNGSWTQNFPTGSRAIWVCNFGSVDITVQAAAYSGPVAPTIGRGIFRVPPTSWMVINAETTDWTVYANTSYQIPIQVFGRTLPPAAGTITAP